MPLPDYVPWHRETLDARRRTARALRRQPVAVLALAMALGIVADRLLGISMVAWWGLAIAMLIGWFVGRQRRKLATACLLTSIALAAAAWHHTCWNLFSIEHVSRYANQEGGPCAVEVVVRECPVRLLPPKASPYRAIPGTAQSRLAIDCQRVRDGTSWIEANGKASLLVEGTLDDIHKGDRLRVFCQFARPRPATNPGSFDYAKHLRADRQLATFATRYNESVTKIETGSSWSILRGVDRLRSDWARQLWDQLNPRSAAMASMLLLGLDGSLPREDTMPFRTTGTTHILVVSGLHTSIVVIVLLFASRLGLLRTPIASLGTVALAGGFAWLTGANPPVVRAAILVGMAAMAVFWGRRVVSYNSLSSALVIVLALNPNELFRTGTQLSFLCVVVLIAFGEWILNRPQTDPIERIVHLTSPLWWRGVSVVWNYVAGAAAATAFVWLVSLPIVLNAFHIATPIGILISPLLLAILGVTLALGFSTLLLGLVSPAAASFAAGGLEKCVQLLDGLVSAAHQVPFGHTWMFGPAAWWVVGVYVGAGILWHLPPSVWGDGRWMRYLAAWTIVGCLPPIFSTMTGERELKCHVLDVGQGACVAIESPDGRLILYDAGALGSPHATTETISSFLWSRGYRRIDGIVISHADVDHFSAIPGLLDRFAVESIYLSPHMFTPIDEPELSPAPAALERLLIERGVKMQILERGDRLRIDSSTTGEVLHPGLLDIAGGDNSRSIVLGIEYEGRRILLPGDLESPGMDAVLADEPYDCDILLAPHHGSRRSEPKGFAEWSTPEWVVVSGSQDLGLEETGESYGRVGARVLNTNVTGCVSFSVTRDKLRVKTHLE